MSEEKDILDKDRIAHVDDVTTIGTEKVVDAVDAHDAKLLELKAIVGEGREEQEKKLLWKIDLRMLPMLMIIYVLNYLDRTNIATARLDSLEKDTGLHGNQYNTVIAIFYVGYVLTQVFSNLVLNKTRPSLLLPGVMCAWAVVSACSGAVQSYGGWIAIRFILGFVESPFFAGAIFLLSSWYTQKELATRLAIMYTASQMSQAFGGLIGQRILNRFETDNRGIEPWRWLFIIEGVITIPFAVLAMFILPDYPKNTRFLNEKERALAQLRILENASKEDADEEGFMTHLKLAFTDPALYLLWIMQLGTVTAATVNAYFPTIVGTLGYSRTKTLLLTAPPWFFSAIYTCLCCLHSDRKNERFWHIVVSLLIALVGFIISCATMQIGARYFSMFLMLAIYGAFNVILGWLATCISRPPAKRAIAYGFVNAFSNVSSTWGSYFYPSKDGPRYLMGMICNIAFTALAIAAAVALLYYLKYRNRKLDQANEEDLATEGVAIGSRTKALAKRWDCDPTYRFPL